MLKNNYHTHMKYCRHAEGMVIDYVKKANELGFMELGMSDHAPILESFLTKEEYLSNWAMDTMSMEEIPDYLNQIEEAKKQFPNMKIYSGFETEFLRDKVDFYKDLYNRVDYLNLGLHFFRSYKENPRVINCYCELDHTNLLEYLESAQEALETGIYAQFVHPDIFMYGYKDKNGNRCFDDLCEYVTREIAKLAIKHNIYLEINTNGLKYCANKHDRSTWLYPYPKFWEIMKEYPVKVIVGADSHTPEALANENVKLVYEFIEELGIHVEERMEIPCKK